MIDFRLHLTLRGLPEPGTATSETARERLDQALRRWNWGSPDSRAAARAVTGELVGDALNRACPASAVSMLLTRSGHRLRIAVTTGATRRPHTEPDHPWTRHPDAAQWGTTSHPGGGTTVWCELLDIPGPRRPAPAETRAARTENLLARAEKVPARAERVPA